MTDESEDEHRQFWTALKNGVFRLLDDAPREWNGPDQRFYRAEKELMAENASPFLNGLAATAFLFMTFRVSGSQWWIRTAQRASRQQQQQPTTSHATAPPSTTAPSTHSTPQFTSYLEQQAQQRNQLISDALRLPTDLLVSLLCGCSATAILLDSQKLENDLATAPLLPGKSLVHKHICPEFTRHLTSSSNSTATAPSNTNTTKLSTLETFVRNCQVRSQFLASRQQTSVRHPDVVPYPGLQGIRLQGIRLQGTTP